MTSLFENMNVVYLVLTSIVRILAHSAASQPLLRTKHGTSPLGLVEAGIRAGRQLWTHRALCESEPSKVNWLRARWLSKGCVVRFRVLLTCIEQQIMMTSRKVEMKKSLFVTRDLYSNQVKVNKYFVKNLNRQKHDKWVTFWMSF